MSILHVFKTKKVENMYKNIFLIYFPTDFKGVLTRLTRY